MADRAGAYLVVARKPVGKRPLLRHRVDGRIILKWIFNKWDMAMDWIGVAQKRDTWRDFVNAVMNGPVS